MGDGDKLTNKGKVAKAVSNNNGALIIAELFENTDYFKKSKSFIAAILSLFVCPKNLGKSDDEVPSNVVEKIRHIETEINNFEKTVGIAPKERYKVEFNNFMFTKIQDLINGQTILELSNKFVSDSNVYAACLIKIVKDIMELVEKLSKVTHGNQKYLLDNLKEILKPIVMEDVPFS